ncbi:hypothetical protein DFH09DRAFT_1097348 [Mycena vulgaris]|nr:hypothetical protein DFH09DRAFT_1097348 [Mycena vulgaris]
MDGLMLSSRSYETRYWFNLARPLIQRLISVVPWPSKATSATTRNLKAEKIRARARIQILWLGSITLLICLLLQLLNSDEARSLSGLAILQVPGPVLGNPSPSSG